MKGYRVEDWSDIQIEKAFKLDFRSDILFKIVRKPPPLLETMVSTSLPICLMDASLPRPDHKDKLSCLAGGLKRLGARVHPVSFEKMKRILIYAREYIFPQFKTFTRDQIKTTEDWIEGINHPDSRKQELREEYNRIKDEGVFPLPGIQKMWNKKEKDPRVADSFIKDEPYPEEKALRWINASSDTLKVVFGPIVDKCMEQLCEHPSIIKTVPVKDRASYIWETLGGYGVIAQSSDATAMEDHYAHFSYLGKGQTLSSEPRYRICNDFMLYLCGQIPVSYDMIKAVKTIFCKTTKHIRDYTLLNRLWSKIEDCETLKSFCKNIIDTYRHLEMKEFGYILVNAILCSGEMNTSLKNTISMYTMCNFAAYDLTEGKVKVIPTQNEGDDSLAVYPPGAAPTEKWWQDWGWVIKVEFVGPINEASFCGLVFDPEVKVSVPDIREALAKFGWTNRRYVGASYKTRMSLLRAKALSMACEYNDVPILGPLSQRLLFLTKGYNVKQSIIWAENIYKRELLQKYVKMKPWMEQPRIDLRTRELVYKLQNISIDQQLKCEEIVSNLSLDEPFFSLPHLDFDPVWVDNMKRCHTVRVVPRTYDLSGRRRVVAAIMTRLFLSQQGLPTWSVGPRNRMIDDLQLLAAATV